jgi:hypothetical protein
LKVNMIVQQAPLPAASDNKPKIGSIPAASNQLCHASVCQFLMI